MIGESVVIDPLDQPLLQELIGLKAGVPGLKVLLAVGGWAFSEDDPTKDLFSFVIADATRRATFIASIKSTLSSFGLDGIDIDFGWFGFFCCCCWLTRVWL